MKIHSDKLGREDYSRAARVACAEIVQFDRSGSRSRAQAHEITLEGVSKSMTQRFPDVRAATYNQWGVFLNVLFELDPDMIAGPYRGIDDFHSKTRNEFCGVDEYSAKGDSRVAKQFRPAA